MRFVLAAGLAVMMGIVASVRAEVPAAQLQQYSRQSVGATAVVENRSGAGGIAAARLKWQEVVKASGAHID